MHKKSIGARTIRAAALAAVLGVTLSTAAFAQFGPPPPPGSPPPFGGPPGGPRFGGPRRGPRPSTAANAPLPALTAGLKLSAAQQTKVADIQERFSRQRRELMPRPPGGPPLDPDPMRGAWDKMRALGQTADAGIAAVLSGPQKAALPALLHTLDDLRMEGILPATYGALKLSGSQTARLTALARTSQQATRQAIDAARRSGDFGSVRVSMQSERRRLASQAASMLTPAQRGIVNSYKAAHPRPPFGGPGGPGGFGPPPPPRGEDS